MRRLLFFACALIVISSCQMAGLRWVKGNGVASSRQRSVGGFSAVEVSGSIDVILSQGAAAVRVEADENLQDYVETEINGNALHIHPRDGYNLRSKTPLKVYVTSPSYTAVSVTGSGDVSGSGRLTGDRISINVTGSGDLALDLDMPSVTAGITGSGTIRLSGQTRDFDSEINGSGDMLAFGLLAEHTKVDIAGSGNAEVFASKQLEVGVAGSGDVRYKGNASVNQSVHGSGSVQKVN